MTPKLLALLAIALVLWLAVRNLTAQHRNQSSKIDLEQLLLDEKGRTDPGRVLLLGWSVLAAWVVVYLTLRDRLTDTIFLGVLAIFATPVVAKIIWGKTDASGMVPLPLPTTTVTTTTQTEVQPPPPAAKPLQGGGPGEQT